MADSSNGSGATALVAIVALAVVGALVWFFVMRGSAPTDGGADIDINIGDPVEAVTE